MSKQAMDQHEVEMLRREYAPRQLSENDIADQPVTQFACWFKQALRADLPDANAMTLATATSSGAPSARVVLLKGFDDKGFQFYTNYNSRKARELQENPQASLCFFWSELERQVRIEGHVEKMSRERSADYFQKRPRQSQLGAWASSQSSLIDSREELEQQLEQIKKRFKGKDIPLPDFWGGFVLKPSSVEFWQGRPGRLHDRIVYTLEKDAWVISRLAP